MFRIQLIIILLIFSSCLRTDYENKIISSWEIEQFEVKFDGAPDPEAKNLLAPFNIGIKFFKDGNCEGIENDKDSNKYYSIGETFFDGNYELKSESLTINKRLNFKIISLNDTTLKMNLFLSLEDYNYNYARLKKLRKQGTGENLIIHYTFRKAL